LGANLVLNKSVFPLTPRFSAVESAPQPTKPFQRFSFAQFQPTGKPLKRLVPKSGRVTALKCGVNGSAQNLIYARERENIAFRPHSVNSSSLTPEIKITGPMASRNSGMICSSEVGGIFTPATG
jgi:hypothetical protein